ncbi:hypothetical protein [Capillimicrobium parvum]|uniref:Uncharacterized protein n=1 Tax=Capillimicrobium parvum TaxID=2884022 RepID=A0A9E6XVI3_9ACTN|nr:hypothetical protein [Capillimicrobium parvum]UGS35252.1 hypothetical protein DSM104329_01639 [Capillimicrobium parvum]
MTVRANEALKRAARARARALELREAAQLERDEVPRAQLERDAGLLERAATALEDSFARVREIEALEVTLADRRSRFTKS